MKDLTLNRRQALKLGAGIAAGMALGGPLFAMQSKGEPILRAIPGTGEQLPVIGVGTNNYSVTDPADIAARREVLASFPRLGCKVIDTAHGYGESEVVIGDILEEIGGREHYFIATKTPMRGDFSNPDAVVQDSFDRLRVETIDLMMIHNLAGLDELTPALVRAKEAGRLRYIGLSTSNDAQYPAVMEAMGRYPFDVVQVDYSIDNRGSADSILPLAAERGMGVMINMPFGGRRRAASLFSQVADRPLPDFAADIDATSWAQVFLKFVLSQPMVTVVIPGMTRVAHLEDNAAAGRGRVPDAALRREIERYWDEIIA